MHKNYTYIRMSLSHLLIWGPSWFSLGTLVSTTIETDHHYIAEILLKVTLNTINHPPTHLLIWGPSWFSLGTLVSTTIETDHHYIAEILLKVTLNTINHPPTHPFTVLGSNFNFRSFIH